MHHSIHTVTIPHVQAFTEGVEISCLVVLPPQPLLYDLITIHHETC